MASSRRSAGAAAVPSICRKERYIRCCTASRRRICSPAAGLKASPAERAASARRWSNSVRCGTASPAPSPACSESLAMPPRDPVADYLDALSRALAFDPRLARRVRREVEDHLQDAIAAEADGPSIAARQRALARFGDCRALAEQYRALSLVASAQRMAASVIVAGGTIFLT